jgi:hypothetical protein
VSLLQSYEAAAIKAKEAIEEKGNEVKAPDWRPVINSLYAARSVKLRPWTFQRTSGELMPRPPNYKQDKKRREDAQKRKNEQEQQRKAERKQGGFPPAPGQ